MLFKVFYKSLFSLIFALILIGNLVIIYDVVTGVPFGRIGERYVGFGDFFQFLNTRTADSIGLAAFNQFNQNFYEWNMGHFTRNMIGTPTGNGFFDVVMIFVNFIGYIIVPVTILINMLTYVVQVIVVALWIVVQFTIFMGGGFASTLPPMTYPL